MRLERFFTKLFCRPVLIEASTRIAFEMTLLSMMDGARPADAVAASFQMRKTDPEKSQRRADGILEMRGQTALIHIDGSIDKNLSALDLMCMDATDLADVDRALATCENNASIRNVMLVINSPGGSVTGVPETGARIAALAETKNVFAYTEGMCCSAAYWLAAQCDQIFCTGSAQVGSIGVYLALVEQSEALKARGLKVTTVKEGSLKAAGAAWKPLTKDEEAHFQDQVTQIGEAFRDAVTAKRPDVAEETMQGQSFFGERNLKLGLVDAIVRDLDEALVQF